MNSKLNGPQISFSAHYSAPFRDDVLCALRRLVDSGTSLHSTANDQPALQRVTRARTPPQTMAGHELEANMGTPTRSAACHTASSKVGSSVGGVQPYERSPLSKRSRQQSRSTPFGLTLQLVYTTIEATLANAVALPSLNRAAGSSSMGSSSSSSSGVVIPMSSAPSSPFVAYVTCTVSCGSSKGGRGRPRVAFPAVVLPNSVNDEALVGAGQRTIASFCDFATSDARFDVDSSHFKLAVSVVDRKKTTGCRSKLGVKSLDLPLPPPIVVGSDAFADRRRSNREAVDELSESDGDNDNDNHNDNHDLGLDDWGGLFDDDDDDEPVKRKPTNRGRGGRGQRGGRGSRGRC